MASKINFIFALPVVTKSLNVIESSIVLSLVVKRSIELFSDMDSESVRIWDFSRLICSDSDILSEMEETLCLSLENPPSVTVKESEEVCNNSLNLETASESVIDSEIDLSLFLSLFEASIKDIESDMETGLYRARTVLSIKLIFCVINLILVESHERS
jgi:hypothetical protein